MTEMTYDKKSNSYCFDDDKKIRIRFRILEYRWKEEKRNNFEMGIKKGRKIEKE